jgi:hypothetical protein
VLGRPLHDQEPLGLPVDAEFSALIDTNEPVFLEGANATTTLLRRMKNASPSSSGCRSNRAAGKA